MDVQDTPVLDTPIPAAPAVEESSSLSDHEAQFGPGAGESEPESDATESTERDRGGRYKSRNSRATAEDVPRIQALTAKARTAEAERDALKAEKAEREKVTAPAPAPPTQAGTAAPRPAPVQSSPQQPVSQTFPTYEQFVAIEGYEQATYEDYVDARADWRFSLRRAAERQQEAAEREHKTTTERVTAHQQRVTAAKGKYTDWDAVVSNDVPISRVLHDAILASEHSADLQYYLGQHREDCAALAQESSEYSSSAVAAMRRYLDTLIAPSTPARNVAAPTGSALALVPPPAPRPPNPVRTGTQTPADTPPGDEDSLAAHEKYYGRKRR